MLSVVPANQAIGRVEVHFSYFFLCGFPIATWLHWGSQWSNAAFSRRQVMRLGIAFFRLVVATQIESFVAFLQEIQHRSKPWLGWFMVVCGFLDIGYDF